MKQLAAEANACIEGIRSIDSEAEVVVWDGHGSGGLDEEDLRGATYIPPQQKPYFNLSGYAAMLFVGQHAMAGTFHAPLCHTFNSRNIVYYRLNDVYVGEFAVRALVAGLQGVPTILLAGDDKAAAEARCFIPDIELAVVKRGKGLEEAEHLSADAACSLVREASARAVSRHQEIEPFTAFAAPFILEIRYNERPSMTKWNENQAEWIDDRTIRITSDSINDLPF